MTRRPATPSFARKKRICASRGWTMPDGDMIALEAGKVVTLRDGVPVEFDHIGQHSRTGDDSDDNLRPLTPDQHKAKSAKDSRERAKERHLTGQNKPKIKRVWPSRPIPAHSDPWGKKARQRRSAR